MTFEDLVVLHCAPVGAPRAIPGGYEQDFYCPPNVLPLLGPLPGDDELPEFEIPGISLPGDDDGGNITDDPEEGQIVGPIIPPDDAGAGTTTAEAEPGSLAADLDGPSPPTDLPTPHENVRERIRENAQEDDCIEGCEDCPPRSEGNWDWNTYLRAGVDEQETQQSGGYAWVGYQVHVCGTLNDAGNGRIKEFMYLTTASGRVAEWDGFDGGSCTLIEAKYAYDTALTHRWIPRVGSQGQADTTSVTEVIPGKEMQARFTFDGLINKATAQLARIAGIDEVKLLWVFESHNTFHYFLERGGRVGPIPKYDVMQQSWQGG